ncbi:MAG: nucleotidyltransferase [Bacteroidetes bacterium HGW-Bacteroidetes-2]|jgi:predicted nucleotidyltransferase component of viral defense system|nr:MAG: nucleotidyltransferase [Bacteroidetes bacterium HGW-Bacteroidetes-2]
MNPYKKQVALLLNVIPEVEKAACFALHGGTAINLFVRDMPRLSVDIDLTYIPIEDRGITFQNINVALENIKYNIENRIPNAKVNHQKKLLKLQIANEEAQIKLEVNQGMRGVIDRVDKRVLCNKAQQQFDAFCTINVVPFGQLFGGKICAALDRQHPRDLFDVKGLLENEGFTEAIKTGFLFALLSSKRPVYEILFPHFIDQSQTFKNQFGGMTSEDFTHENFENTHVKILEIIHSNLSKQDRDFIISFLEVNPDWSLYDFQNFPAVQWKLQNLKKLKINNPEKYVYGVSLLKENLNKRA